MGISYFFDRITFQVPLYRGYGTGCFCASSGASRPLGGAAPLGVFHRVRSSALALFLSVPPK